MNPAPTTPLLTAHTSLPDEDSLDETRIRYPRYVEPPSDIAVLPPLVMTDAIAHNLLTRSSSLVLTQAGFEGRCFIC